MSYEILYDRINGYARKHLLPFWSCDVVTQTAVFEVPLKYTVPAELTYWKIDSRGRRLYQIDITKRAGKLFASALFRDIPIPDASPRYLSRKNRGELV